MQFDELLTPDEVVVVLRLDAGRKRPLDAVRWLRRTGQLPGVSIAGKYLYRADVVKALIEHGGPVRAGRGKGGEA